MSADPIRISATHRRRLGAVLGQVERTARMIQCAIETPDGIFVVHPRLPSEQRQQAEVDLGRLRRELSRWRRRYELDQLVEGAPAYGRRFLLHQSTVSDLDPSALGGYGPVDPEAVHELRQDVEALDAILDDLVHTFLHPDQRAGRMPKERTSDAED
jgi:hypothetical protein